MPSDPSRNFEKIWWILGEASDFWMHDHAIQASNKSEAEACWKWGYHCKQMMRDKVQGSTAGMGETMRNDNRGVNMLCMEPLCGLAL